MEDGEGGIAILLFRPSSILYVQHFLSTELKPGSGGHDADIEIAHITL